MQISVTPKARRIPNARQSPSIDNRRSRPAEEDSFSSSSAFKEGTLGGLKGAALFGGVFGAGRLAGFLASDLLGLPGEALGPALCATLVGGGVVGAVWGGLHEHKRGESAFLGAVGGGVAGVGAGFLSSMMLLAGSQVPTLLPTAIGAGVGAALSVAIPKDE